MELPNMPLRREAYSGGSGAASAAEPRRWNSSGCVGASTRAWSARKVENVFATVAKQYWESARKPYLFKRVFQLRKNCGDGMKGAVDD